MTHYKEVCEFGAQCRCPGNKLEEYIECTTPKIHNKPWFVLILPTVQDSNWTLADTRKFIGQTLTLWPRRYRTFDEAMEFVNSHHHNVRFHIVKLEK